MITDKINKLSLPATILIASIILGGFYFASQVIELRAKKQQQDDLRFERGQCLTEAEQRAVERYKMTCIYNCKEGYFYIADKDNYLKTCLQRKGLQ